MSHVGCNRFRRGSRLGDLHFCDYLWSINLKTTTEVPLNPDVVRLLATHGKEFMQEDKDLADSSHLPLVRTLQASVAQWGRAGCFGDHGV